MTDITENEVNEVQNLVAEIRQKSEKYGQDSAEFKQFSAKAEAKLDAYEAKNAELTQKLVDEQKAREDLEDQFSELQVSMARKSEAGQNYKETPEYKALNKFVAQGVDALNSEEKALLRSDSDTAGGYLTDNELDTEIIRKITEISPVRSVARVRSVSRKTLEMPKRNSIPSATYEGEAQAGDDSTSSYGTETITAFRQTVTVPVTMDLMLDSRFDIESEIMADVAESFAQGEGRQFVLGDGAKKPEGFLSNDTIVLTVLLHLRMLVQSQVMTCSSLQVN